MTPDALEHLLVGRQADFDAYVASLPAKPGTPVGLRDYAREVVVVEGLSVLGPEIVAQLAGDAPELVRLRQAILRRQSPHWWEVSRRVARENASAEGREPVEDRIRGMMGKEAPDAR